MKLSVKIKRFSKEQGKGFWQEFLYEGNGLESVAEFLCSLNERENLRTAQGDSASRIAWDCSCLERKCGACSMVINGEPMLACAAFLGEVSKRGTVKVEPLSKFPIIEDLRVDRSAQFEKLVQAQVWVQDKTDDLLDSDVAKLRADSQSCLQCGCCLEVCPNFLGGAGFGGASLVASAFSAISVESNIEHKNAMQGAYMGGFLSGCGEALSCQKVCPVKLPLDDIQARTNKMALRKSN